MNYWAIYNTANGALVAIATHLGALPTGQAARSLGESAPDLDRWQWDASTLALVPRQPARIIPTWMLIDRLSDQEQRDFLGFQYKSAKPEAQREVVSAFKEFLQMRDMVNLDATNIVAGIQYLETVGVLQAGRAAVILS